MVTVFSNFFINDEERFLRLKDSFDSIKYIKSDNWVINCRGEYSEKVHFFLESNLKKKLHFSTEESGKGWFFDTSKLLFKIKNNDIFYWVEDHICLVSCKKLNEILCQFESSSVEFFYYSWWFYYKKYQPYLKLEKTNHNNFYSYHVTKNNAKDVLLRDPNHYIISLTGVFKKKLFFKLVNSREPLLRRWPKNTPFDMEKKITDSFWLPLNIGIPKIELFSSIDDDMDDIPSCLITRGLYPNRVGVIKRGKRSLIRSYLLRTLLGRLLKKIRYFFIKIYYTSDEYFNIS